MKQPDEQLDDILKGRFIRRVFEQEAKDIDKAQVLYMTRNGFENSNWYSDRSFVSDESTLVYTQLKKHRFVDMKTRNTAKGKIKKKQHPIHNRIIYGHYNNIIREMAFGFTDAVKAQLHGIEK
jgi:hypothetical protein